MLKNSAAKKILQIMGKTTVYFTSGASSIYHCFLLLALPLVMSDVHLIQPEAACSRLPGIYCLWLTLSVVNLVTLHRAVSLKHHGARAEPLLR